MAKEIKVTVYNRHGVEYTLPSITEAARFIGVSAETISSRLYDGLCIHTGNAVVRVRREK